MKEQFRRIHHAYLQFLKRFEVKNAFARRVLLVLLFLFAANWFYNYIGIYSYLHVRPTSIHSSAQCQRASIALNYYEGDMNFFKPRVQKYSEMGGVTGVEFPIVYYLDALAYKLFGFNEIYGRLISLAILTLGILLFYLMAQRLLGSAWMALTVTGSAAFSPVLMFYAPNFMPDAPSMALVLASWFYFFRYLENKRNSALHGFFLLSALAGLIKVVALISPVALLCIAILDKWGFYKRTHPERIFPKLWPVIAKTLAAVLVVVSWYVYANWLAKAYHNETFSLSPVQGDEGTLKSVLGNIKALWLYHYYSTEGYNLMLYSLLLLALLYKWVNRLLFSVTLLFFLGNLVFVYFFLNQFINHDYYIISILPLVFFLFLTMADAVMRFSRQVFSPLLILYGIILFFNMKEAWLNCRKNYELRYSNEVYYWNPDERPWFDLEPRLRAAGIKRDDLTICGFDDTFCSSLYHINQIGFTIATWDDASRIKEYMSFPKSKYLILNDSARFNALYPNTLSKHVLFSHRGLIVYKLPR